jgi:hypothetical protein
MFDSSLRFQNAVVIRQLLTAKKFILMIFMASFSIISDQPIDAAMLILMDISHNLLINLSVRICDRSWCVSGVICVAGMAVCVRKNTCCRQGCIKFLRVVLSACCTLEHVKRSVVWEGFSFPVVCSCDGHVVVVCFHVLFVHVGEMFDGCI